MEKLIVAVMVVFALSLGLTACSKQPASTPAPPTEEKAAMPEGSEMKSMEDFEAEPMEGSESMHMEDLESMDMEDSEMDEELSGTIEEGDDMMEKAAAEVMDEASEMKEELSGAIEEGAKAVEEKAAEVMDKAPAAMPEVPEMKPVLGSEHK